MKLYAAIGGGPLGSETARRAGFKNILMSYAEGEKNVMGEIFESRRHGCGFFLDSGAFAVHTRGLKIRIEDYIAFCLRVHTLIDVVACLDVIGDPVATLRNERLMESAGLEPLVTCHFGMSAAEVISRFEGRKRGALGGMAMRSRSGRELRMRWLDEVFNGLMKSSVWPIKIHGYGMTDTTLIERYPWHSVDSTTWGMSAVYGNEMIPQGRHLVQRDSKLHPTFGTVARVQRAMRSGARLARFGDYCTRLWANRGITWD